VVTRFQVYNSLLWGSRSISATNESITPVYIASNHFNTAAFANPTNLALDVPGIMTNIGGVSSNLFGFSPLWLFPDIRVYRSGFWVNYARRGFQPSRALFDMRYNAIQALKTTLGSGLSWQRAEPTNYFVWTGTGSTWSAAVGNAAISASAGADLAPMCFTMGRRDAADLYTFRAVKRSASLLVGCINTNTPSALAYYARASTGFAPPPGVSLLTTNVQAVAYHDYSEGLTETNYCRFSTDLTAAYRSNAVSSAVLGDADPLAVTCDQPVDVGASTARGFYIDAQAAMVDWDF
jgi:hypothetical protein